MKSRQLPSDESSVRLKARGRVSEQTFFKTRAGLEVYVKPTEVGLELPQQQAFPNPTIHLAQLPKMDILDGVGANIAKLLYSGNLLTSGRRL
ncbi:hypothetical protein MGG_15332 [Pyricularia oryzae 70-15]|uniref:Uncharacterized protein n=1 Tax=Pyricularia oryzae (strain 70-15 / ATCC MYA-4617 / FGSC 8958) TaxID=242507 RepID=G4MWQ5_PYRO7|nr:uncharacterized protein MGG_15332 [Pyricularia oryzae 70-15]EHA55110.1 hypothetical protein MGG_15332 [Pyricularia oryzae 70-15]